MSHKKIDYSHLALRSDSAEVVSGRGKNIIPPPERESMWRSYLEKFKDPIIIILLVAFVLAVGLAFYDLYTNTAVDLYNADKSHPSAVGSYVAALSLFSEIFGCDPMSITAPGPGTEEENAKIREAVAKIITQTPTIPEDYKTDSTGVTVTQE